MKKGLSSIENIFALILFLIILLTSYLVYEEFQTNINQLKIKADELKAMQFIKKINWIYIIGQNATDQTFIDIDFNLAAKGKEIILKDKYNKTINILEVNTPNITQKEIQKKKVRIEYYGENITLSEI